MKKHGEIVFHNNNISSTSRAPNTRGLTQTHYKKYITLAKYNEDHINNGMAYTKIYMSI